MGYRASIPGRGSHRFQIGSEAHLASHTMNTGIAALGVTWTGRVAYHAVSSSAEG
jgi:hypothetical protein